MAEANLHIIALKKFEEKKLEELFNHYSKIENNILKFNEFLMFALDRNMLSNRFGLTCFYQNYLKALEAEIKPPTSALLNPMNSPNKGPMTQPMKQEIKYDVSETDFYNFYNFLMFFI